MVCSSIAHVNQPDTSNSRTAAKGMLNLGGDTCGAPLPTLAGWVLEYPIVYYVDDALSGNCLPEQELLLFRFELPGADPSTSSSNSTARSPELTVERNARESSASKHSTLANLVARHHVLSFTVPEELYGEAGKRAVEGLKARIAQRVAGAAEMNRAGG
eukprot:CAMPEP_0196733172 /NCGR_PEP_ID=MMETSP1091-20130531/12348_1 /TAXON_ID=302021 /ORGANISM="Rhodomonas sp., Strain CCMP768" /LENGTH=158 /DNA_ID=CAMNT_0042076529 /DNA_START=61 /DNA_END=534 /DNA_ORIENTATION=+